MKPRNLSKRSFLILGVVFGIILALLVRKAVPKIIVGMNFALTEFLYGTPENAVLIILVFFVIEVVLAMIFRKPFRSTQMTLGVLIFPIVWALIAEYDYPFFLQADLGRKVAEYVGGVIAGMVIVLPMWFAALVLSLVNPYIVGIDAYNLEEGRTLPNSFGYRIDFVRDSNIDFTDTLMHRLGFSKNSQTMLKGNLELSLYSKDELKMGLVLERLDNKSLNATFSFFSIENDVVEKCEDAEEILDYEAQIKSLLEVRRGNKHEKQVEKIEHIEPLLDVVRQIAKGLGRKKIPPLSQIRQALTGFPKTHPYIFSFVLVILGGAIVEFLRIWLESVT